MSKPKRVRYRTVTGLSTRERNAIREALKAHAEELERPWIGYISYRQSWGYRFLLNLANRIVVQP